MCAASSHPGCCRCGEWWWCFREEEGGREKLLGWSGCPSAHQSSLLTARIKQPKPLSFTIIKWGRFWLVFHCTGGCGLCYSVVLCLPRARVHVCVEGCAQAHMWVWDKACNRGRTCWVSEDGGWERKNYPAAKQTSFICFSHKAVRGCFC